MDYPPHPPHPPELPHDPYPAPRPALWGSQPRLAPDPGTPGWGKLALFLAIILIGIVAIFQQTAPSSAAKAAGQPPLAPGAAPPPPVQMELMAKAGVKLYYVSPAPKPGDTAQSAQRETLAQQIIDSMRSSAHNPHDRLRLAIVRADLQGPDAGLDELDKLQDHLRNLPTPLPTQASEDLNQDIQHLRALYRGQELPDARDALVDRHGWFGKLAATRGLNDSHPDRQEVIGGGLQLTFLLVGLVVLILLLFLAGLTLLITAIVLASTGKLRSHFIPPLPGGSIAAETVVVFVSGFIALKLIVARIETYAGADTATIAALLGQWLLLLLIFWPILRGTPLRQWAALSGLHRGRGFLREVGAGILGYLACIPILVAGIILTLILVRIQAAIQHAAGKPAPAPENQIIDLVGGSSGPAAIILLFLLASLWAPIVEEAIFRGALYRHLRGWWHWLPAGIVTALGFGLMHGYPLILLGPVIALGFGFAMIREWRGSLIASMTAHAIHNAATLTILLTFIALVG
jgi:membrane protease YdiL (CAAX protease family)